MTSLPLHLKEWDSSLSLPLLTRNRRLILQTALPLVQLPAVDDSGERVDALRRVERDVGDLMRGFGPAGKVFGRREGLGKREWAETDR